MKFEIIVKYLERNDTGAWGDTPKTLKRIIKHDDIDGVDDEAKYNKLANFCIAQNARRDVLVTDYEVFEYVKRPIKVNAAKDSRGGVIIKNKRYRLNGTIDNDDVADVYNDTNDVSTANTVADAPQARVAAQPTPANITPQPAPDHVNKHYDFAANKGKIIPAGTEIDHPLTRNMVSWDHPALDRSLVFSPPDAPPPDLHLTVGKQYQVIARVRSKMSLHDESGQANKLLIGNDIGGIVRVNDIDFVSPLPDSEDYIPYGTQARNNNNSDMPTLR